MKKAIYLFAILFSVSAFAADPSISSVRISFQEATKNEDVCRKLLSTLQPYNEKNNPLLAGYKGCVTMLLAKYTFNPFTKLSHFSKGKKILQAAIDADNDNIELRFLRFAAQSKSPGFLNYKGSVNTDKDFLLKNYGHIRDVQLKYWLVNFLKKSDELTALEKQRLQI